MTCWRLDFRTSTTYLLLQTPPTEFTVISLTNPNKHQLLSIFLYGDPNVRIPEIAFSCEVQQNVGVRDLNLLLEPGNKVLQLLEISYKSVAHLQA